MSGDQRRTGGRQAEVPEGQVSTYHGHVQVRGRLKGAETLVLLNGEPAPEGFDPTTLAKGAIDQDRGHQLICATARPAWC
jgi:hypothetical protein